MTMLYDVSMCQRSPRRVSPLSALLGTRLLLPWGPCSLLWVARSGLRAGVLASAAVLSLACNDLSGLAGKQELPAGTSYPSAYNTPAGALALYHGVLAAFETVTDTAQSNSNGVFVDFVLASGLLTDEFQWGQLGGNQLDYGASIGIGSDPSIDARQLPEGLTYPTTDQVYTELQGLRNSAGIAIAALAAYDSTASPALRGQMYAMQGYSMLLLADLYCSGIPLSTLNFGGGFTLHAGTQTAQLYETAVAKFDTALALSADSVNVLNLARVGKGRAFLDLGQYDSAAVAVDSVLTSFAYQFPVNWGATSTGNAGGLFGEDLAMTVADSEGLHGLPYISSNDPRSASSSWGTNNYGVPQYAPNKYGGATPGLFPITVADGIEARLIQAEAAYHGVTTGQGSWLEQLNTLRQSAPVAPSGVPMPNALTPLQDPGTDSGRVALLFRERALWLFATGHREGDLRRLLREYQTIYPSQSNIYPTGLYPLFGPLTRYGSDVTAPIPTTEHANPLFTGCQGRGA